MSSQGSERFALTQPASRFQWAGGSWAEAEETTLFDRLSGQTHVVDALTRALYLELIEASVSELSVQDLALLGPQRLLLLQQLGMVERIPAV